MKTGAESDPFAQDGEDEQETENESVDMAPESDRETETQVDEQNRASTTASPTDNADGAIENQRNSTVATPEPSRTGDTTDPAVVSHALAGDGPGFVLTRSRVKDDRDAVTFHLHSETIEAQKKAVGTVENLVGTDVYQTDLREAALLVGLQHPEEVARTLNEWGYEHLD